MRCISLQRLTVARHSQGASARTNAAAVPVARRITQRDALTGSAMRWAPIHFHGRSPGSSRAGVCNGVQLARGGHVYATLLTDTSFPSPNPRHGGPGLRL
jgi:hypothetical protein